MVREAGGDRVQVLDVENLQGLPVYVHSKLCVIDDVWAAVGSDNFNTRSWTHDSELTAAVLDSERDQRSPTDPGGLGDGARRFARELRLRSYIAVPLVVRDAVLGVFSLVSAESGRRFTTEDLDIDLDKHPAVTGEQI